MPSPTLEMRAATVSTSVGSSVGAPDFVTFVIRRAS